MLSRIFFFLFFFIFLFSGYSQRDLIPGQLIVQLKPGFDWGQLQKNNNAEKKICRIDSVRPISKGMRIYLVFCSAGKEMEMIRQLQKQPEVAIAQVNHRIFQREKTPDDPLFQNQWPLKNTGQGGGISGADIRAPEAWQISTGGITKSRDTIVLAIIDDGFQADHPDLKDNIFINFQEIPGNGLDDDGNGFTDDVSGWNAYNNSGIIPVRAHGSHISGIAAAKGNNGIGVSGINWDIKILPVAGSSESEAVAVAAYGYVVEMRRQYNISGGTKGAFVVATNSSFGVNLGRPEEFPIWCSMYDTLGKYGILNAAATTNSNINIDIAGDIPTTCASEFLISVTNSTASDEKNVSAGFGPVNIDIAAPGTSIYSLNSTGGYGYRSGTSMASPHVAGAICLMYSVLSEKWLSSYAPDPMQEALAIKEMLYNGAANPGSLNNLVSKGRRLDLMGALLEVEKANEEILRTETIFQKPIISLFPNPAGNFFRVLWPGMEPMYLEIKDFTGRLIYETSFFLPGNLVNLTDIQTGMYFLNIINPVNRKVESVPFFHYAE